MLIGQRQAVIPAGRFLNNLSEHGDRVALVDRDGARLTYAELDRRADARVTRLGTSPSFVVLAADTSVTTIEWYLACLRSGHPVLLTDPDNPARAKEMARRFGASCVISGERLDAVGSPSSEELAPHPDLAVLMATSGSTGAPKLVRLSHRNLAANARSIAEYLELTDRDVAVTTLPMHYCYGLSVIHSHLMVGASVVLNDESVLAPDFWSCIDEFSVTGFAGVPHTFDLLATLSDHQRSRPSLRYLTQAGGRLAPSSVEAHGRWCSARDIDLFIMYGQTEATARMCFVPPKQLLDHLDVVGVPIPGGEIQIVDEEGEGVEPGIEGAVVYRGDNVMMGYAESADDFARPASVDELHTGDLGRITDDGFLSITGRSSRFAKLFGLRIDLDHIERQLVAAGHDVVCVDGGDRLVLASDAAEFDLDASRSIVNEIVTLPPTSIVGHHYEDGFPRLSSGKLDGRRIADDAAKAEAAPADDPSVATVAAVFRRHLGIEPDADQTFVDLGGDSLRYIEVTLDLEELITDLPNAWHLEPVSALEERRVESARRGASAGRSASFVSLDTDVALRAVSIVMIVSQHFGLISLLGGAHVLLAAFGFNLARFQVPALGQRGPRPLLESAARLVVPTLGWTTVVALVSPVSIANYLLITNYWTSSAGETKYWFIEVLVQLLVVFALVVSIRPLRERVLEHQVAAGVALLGTGLALRFGLHGWWDATAYAYKIPTVLVWLVGLGWLAAVIERPVERLALSAVTIVTTWGFFESPSRSLVIIGGILALVWIRSIPVPAIGRKAVASVASASMYIYLTHFQVTSPLQIESPLIRTVVAIGLGIVAARIAQPILAWLEAQVRAGTTGRDGLGRGNPEQRELSQRSRRA